MIKKIILVLLLMELVSGIAGCCSGGYEGDYQWVDFSIYFLDNSGTEPVVIYQGDEINKKAFGLRVNLIGEEIAEKPSFTFTNTAYACSGDYYGEPIHTLNEIKVKTINDYSDNYLEGSDVTALFKLLNSNNEYISIDEISENNYGYLGEFDLYLMDTTANGNTQIFEIELLLSDGAILENQTEPIILN